MRIIESPPAIFRRLYAPGEFRLDPGEPGHPSVYLTFDDGPIPESTPYVLDLLDSFGIKATFFMVGDNVRKYPGLYREVLSRGHRVGNHTMHHLQGLRCATERYLEDVRQAEGYIDSDLFRPPHGAMRRAQTRAIARHYRIVMMDVVSRDYSHRLCADDVERIVRRWTRPGSVVVFHDSIRSIPRREALPRSIEWLLEEGYEFKLI